jgi:hypothetical protein
MFNWLCPDLYLNSIFEIKPEFLRQKGIRGVIVDLDNTLVPWNEARVNKDISEWFQGFKDLGIKLCIVSNNKKHRVLTFGEKIGIPTIYKAKKPRKKSFLKGMQILKTKPSNTAVIGDQIFTDILGGNRLGLYTILVIPISKKEFLWTRLMRSIEKAVLNFLIKKGHLTPPER